MKNKPTTFYLSSGVYNSDDLLSHINKKMDGNTGLVVLDPNKVPVKSPAKKLPPLRFFTDNK